LTSTTVDLLDDAGVRDRLANYAPCDVHSVCILWYGSGAGNYRL